MAQNVQGEKLPMDRAKLLRQTSPAVLRGSKNATIQANAEKTIEPSVLESFEKPKKSKATSSRSKRKAIHRPKSCDRQEGVRQSFFCLNPTYL